MIRGSWKTFKQGRASTGSGRDLQRNLNDAIGSPFASMIAVVPRQVLHSIKKSCLGYRQVSWICLSDELEFGYRGSGKLLPAVIVAMLSFVCLVCGVGLAGLSVHDTERAPWLERLSGFCLLAGLGLLGAALPLLR